MKLEYIFGIFATICFIFALIFSSSSQRQTDNLPGKGGIFGPITVKEKNSVFKVRIRNHVPLNKWSEITVNVLDKDKKFLFSFGDGMWHESGYEGGSRWVESKNKFDMKMTLKQPGQYYLDVEAERNDGKGRNIGIIVEKQKGSLIPFLVLGFIGAAIAVGLHYVNQETRSRSMSNPIQSKPSTTSKSTLLVTTGVLSVLFLFALLFSIRGYGYMGYYGYHSGPSFFYWGGPKIYRSPSHRSGSIGGSGHRGGGFSGGK